MQPRFFLRENVRGLLSALLYHRPLLGRGASFALLAADERAGAALNWVLEEINKIGYKMVYGLLNGAD